MNTLIVIGNLGQDPELKYTPSGTAVVNFSIAVNEHYKDKDGNKVQKTNWFRVNAFQRTAEIISEYCKKGSRIGITGQLQQRIWTDKDGGNHSVVEIRAREIELLSAREGNGNNGHVNPPPTNGSEFAPPLDDDDIPF